MPYFGDSPTSKFLRAPRQPAEVELEARGSHPPYLRWNCLLILSKHAHVFFQPGGGGGGVWGINSSHEHPRGGLPTHVGLYQPFDEKNADESRTGKTSGADREARKRETRR